MSSNQKKIVFLTPNELDKMDIDASLANQFQDDELDDLFPFILDELKESVRETTLGAMNGDDIEYSVENSDCKVFMCISINGKLCRIHDGEWKPEYSILHQLPVDAQVRLFQRLIAEKQITLEDLASEDIDTFVYKRLVINELNGADICRKKIEQLDKLWETQQEDNGLSKLHEHILNAI